MPARQPHQGLIQEVNRLQVMAREWLRLFPQAASQGQHWLKVLSQVRAHVAEEGFRLAVVGTVKAGKSTVINALVGRDLLKRGAGILTAMITRVQPGPEDMAVLKFKEWDEINLEIQRALGLLPSNGLLSRATPLDLENAADRQFLGQVLAEAQSADLWQEGSLDPNFLLLKSYLEGYDLLVDLLPASGILSLAGPELARHRELVTRETTAVYLKDVLLTIPFPWAASGLELGDCQGSDSPMPQHLAQVLAYLLKSDLVLYAVSSRVGLRQADHQFLGELKRMGLGSHILTVLNLDLGEHGSLYEVVRLKERVRQELALWQPQPRLYAFSALKMLLEQRRRTQNLDPREAATLALWAMDPETAAFSDQEAARFVEELQAALQGIKEQRLAGGSLSQVRMVARGLKEQLELTRDLLGKDLGAIKDMESRLQARRQPLQATLASLHQTLEGASQNLKKVLKNRVSSLMDRHSGQVGAALEGFISAYEPNWERLLPAEAPATFRPALYQLFQEFLKELAHYVTAQINVSLVEFIRTQEEWLRQELSRLGAPLLLSLQEALTLYYHEIQALGLAASPPTLKMADPPRLSDLEVPLLTLQLDPGWRLSGEAWVRSGVGSLARVWEALKRRLKLGQEVDLRRQLLKDLARALKALKLWVKEEAKSQLLDYEERLKFRYFFPLVDQWLTHQEAALKNTLDSLVADLEGVTGDLRLEEEERQARQHRLEELLPEVREIEMRLLGGGGQGLQTPAPSPNPLSPSSAG